MVLPPTTPPTSSTVNLGTSCKAWPASCASLMAPGPVLYPPASLVSRGKGSGEGGKESGEEGKGEWGGGERGVRNKESTF